MADEPYNPSPIGNPSVLARRNWWQTKLVIFIGKHTPKCRDMVRILSQSMDKPMPLSMRIKKRIHYLICCWCQRYEEQLLYMRKTALRFAEHADEASAVPVSGEIKERWKQALRAEPRSSRSTLQEKGHVHVSHGPVVPRRTWNFIFLVAAAALLLAAFLFWMNPPRAPVSLADYRDEMISFVKVAPNLEMQSKQLSEVMDFLDKESAPSRFAIPEKVRAMEPAGCRVLRFHGHNVTLVCFWRKDGGLLHLFVMDRAALPNLPDRKDAKYSAQNGWTTAAWNEGDHTFLIAVQGDLQLIEQLLTNS
ncbi:MAG TPA: hypothetical protein VM717_01775 [Chthoniobacterales bacterium]|jgi:hypothetical protein|nr:hypothetical protein [Chthoniobacterales bacterium]